MLSKIKKFFGFSDKKEEENAQISILKDKIEAISDKKEEKVENSDEIQRVLLSDTRTSGIKEEFIEETINQYKKRKAKEQLKVKNQIKEVIKTRMSVNDLYMQERFGVIPKRKSALCYPNFMAVNFNGFIVGKCIEDNSIVIFAGVQDVSDRNLVLNGRKITYNLLMRYISSDKIYHGFRWFKVKDLSILKQMYETGEFYDNASKIWLSDYFNYLEFIERYRVENPAVRMEIDEIEVKSK